MEWPEQGKSFNGKHAELTPDEQEARARDVAVLKAEARRKYITYRRWDVS